MKNLPIAALLAVAALALAGCTTGAPEALEAPSASPLSAETVHAAKPAQPTPADIKAAKADAIAAGRPAAAWDKNCIAWEVPKAGTKGQAWANELGAEFLESKSASCPDAIMHPYYFIDTFKPGTKGELVITVEQSMNAQLYGPERGQYRELDAIAQGVMAGIMDENLDLKKVSVKLPNGSKYGTANRAQTQDARNEGGIL